MGLSGRATLADYETEIGNDPIKMALSSPSVAGWPSTVSLLRRSHMGGQRDRVTHKRSKWQTHELKSTLDSASMSREKRF